MKKYILAFPLSVWLLFACDPITESDGSASAPLTADQLKQRVTITQTVPNQNHFTYKTDPSTFVQVMNQNGGVVSFGTSGSIIGIPTLSSLTFRVLNQDGSFTSFTQDVSIGEYVDVPEVYRLLFGEDYISKTWQWARNGEPVVGNGFFDKETFAPAWWTIKLEDFNTSSGYLVNQGGNSTMEFKNGDTIVLTYEDGTTNQGSVSNPRQGGARFDTWYGTISISTGVLGGVSFNPTFLGQGATVKDYQIVELTETRLVVAFSESEKLDNQSNGWYWIFEAKPE